jgi:hypothetical protein
MWCLNIVPCVSHLNQIMHGMWNLNIGRRHNRHAIGTYILAKMFVTLVIIDMSIDVHVN